MSEQNVKARLQLKTDTSENWSKATGFIPKKGEPIVYQEENSTVSRVKIGDNAHTPEELSFIENLPIYDGTYREIYAGETEDVTLISFTIASSSAKYQAEAGMTWTQWCDSAYNIGYHYSGDGGVYNISCLADGTIGIIDGGAAFGLIATDDDSATIASTDLIIDGYEYSWI